MVGAVIERSDELTGQVLNMGGPERLSRVDMAHQVWPCSVPPVDVRSSATFEPWQLHKPAMEIVTGLLPECSLSLSAPRGS